jgi:DNA-binding NtrC family response regulator
MPSVRLRGRSLPTAFVAALAKQQVEAAKDGAVDLVHAPVEEGPPRRDSDRPWIWLVATPCPVELAARAVAAGAYDVVCLKDAEAAAHVAARLSELATSEPTPPDDGPFVAVSEATKKLRRQLALAARTSMPVLLTGETGTGKEVSAKLLHAWSSRQKARFIPINCAAIPNELMEAELFGYAKGSFSGATHRFDGQLMAAQGGTVFLDEIDDTPLPTQIKLLRVLEDRVVTRIGENEPNKVDFRILAATNRDLRPLIESGAFGADLYERLAIVTVQLPPLRERIEDLPELVRFFIERFKREEPEHTCRVVHVAPSALSALAEYPWPGNIRELRNVLFEALVYKRAGETLLLSDLPRRILQKHANRPPPTKAGTPLVHPDSVAARLDQGALNLKQEVESFERLLLTEALRRTKGNASAAARLLGEVGRGSASDPGGTVRAMMRRLGVKTQK